MARACSHTFPYAIGTTFISKCAKLAFMSATAKFYCICIYCYTVYVVPHYTSKMYGSGLQTLMLRGVPIGHQAEAIRIG